MNRAPLWRALLALLIVGTTGYFAFTKEPRLGLDLEGGTQIVLETRDVDDAETTARAVPVLERRVNGLGISEATVVQSGTKRMIVELPGVTDPEAAREAVGRTAQLTFHPVLGATGLPGELPPGTLPDGIEPGTEPPAEDAPAEDAPAGETVPEGEPAPEDSPAAAGIVDAPPMKPVRFSQDATPTPSASPAATGGSSAPPSPTPSPGTILERTFDPTLEQQQLPSDQGDEITIGPAALTGESVANAGVVMDPNSGSRQVSIEFKGDGGEVWRRITGEAACFPEGDPKRRIAIVLDGEVISSPNANAECNVGIQGGRTVITGRFGLEEAQNLAALIEGGALPVPVDIVSSSTVGPTLGEEAIDASIRAGIIGLSLTGLFLIAVYRLAGFLATVALACYGVISYGTLTMLGATLTLPGLAGLLLSAGLAIDANVLVYERAREEFAAQRKPRLISALDNGFNKALSAIADSNITTLLAAVLLFFLAAGPVRGFGVTLVIGVLSSLVSALLVTRVLAEFAVKRGIVFRRPRLSGLAHLGRFREWIVRRDPDLMARRRLWLAISAAMVLVAIGGMLVRGFNFGVEFTGGRVVEYATSEEFSVNEVRRAITDAGFPTAVVQESGEPDDPTIAVRTGDVTSDDRSAIADAVTSVVPDAKLFRDDSIGPSLGSETRNRAILALVIALAAQLLYLAVRFRWTFSAAAVLAMFHDVVIVLGLFAWLGKPIDGVFLAAALTIIGVSVNDSIVTLDRIRETWGEHRTRPLPGIVNSAILQTAPRTINTGLGAMFILAALTFLGGASLQDFALALLIGLIVGTYSSAFTAAPLLIAFEKRSKVPPPMPKRKGGYSSAGGRKRGPQPIFQTRGGGARI